MQGNFSYHNPTKLYFGDESLNFLKDELKNFGPVVLLNYGSGSVKRNGIYQRNRCYPRHDSRHYRRHHLLSCRLHGPKAGGYK